MGPVVVLAHQSGWNESRLPIDINATRSPSGPQSMRFRRGSTTNTIFFKWIVLVQVHSHFYMGRNHWNHNIQQGTRTHSTNEVQCLRFQNASLLLTCFYYRINVINYFKLTYCFSVGRIPKYDYKLTIPGPLRFWRYHSAVYPRPIPDSVGKLHMNVNLSSFRTPELGGC